LIQIQNCPACIIRFSFSGYINSGNDAGFLKRRVKNVHQETGR
jgi:hypothetical protein